MESPVSNVSTGLNFIVANVSGPWMDLTKLGVEIRQYGSDNTNRELLFPEGWEQNLSSMIIMAKYRVVEIRNLNSGTLVQLNYPVTGAAQIPAVATSFRIIA